MRDAWNGVMRTLFERDQTRAEKVRQLELALENTEAAIARQREAMQRSREHAEKGGAAAEEGIGEVHQGERDVDRAAPARRRAAAQAPRAAARDEPKPEGGWGKVKSSYSEQATKLSGKSGEKGYWARPTELLARAFEAYVFDKIKVGERISQYLVQGVEAERYASGYRGNPYPVGSSARRSTPPSTSCSRRCRCAKARAAGRRCTRGSGTPVATLTGKELGEFGDNCHSPARGGVVFLQRQLAKTQRSIRRSARSPSPREGAARKFVSTSADPRKLQMVPALRDIIEKGTLIRSTPATPRSAHDNIGAYHWVEANVDLAGAPLRVGVSIFEDANGNKFYNLNQDLDRFDETRGAQLQPASQIWRQRALARGPPRPRLQSGRWNLCTNNLIPSGDGINIAIGAVQPPRLGDVTLSEADKQKIKDKLKAILRQLAPRANLAFVDDLVDGKAVGKYEALRNLITVSLGYGDPEVTLRHEAIHALREAGLFTDAEWAVLEQAARRDWAKQVRHRRQVSEPIQGGADRGSDRPDVRRVPAG